jgi:protein O-GlcNAc transferase
MERRWRLSYLEHYHAIDIGLDTLPYNGHTTSLDSYWMGVPVITLVGHTAIARAGWSQLNNLGLPELAAQSPTDFVRIAADLARDTKHLTHLRSTLRQRMQQSPLMNSALFAQNIESAYRHAWRQWASQPKQPL